MVELRTNVRPSSIKVPDSYQGINWDKQIENRKSSTRARVEHPYLIVKNQFGYRKTVYRGIKKNLNRFYMLFASANLVMCYRAGRAKDFCMA
ncbi:transposase, IS5 family [Anaerocolumna jejuensis DSM 15929]|uniref:Transposase, IS5 family n=1 Tax=Anaerocolumna jejuensis DSM 15929 TaxID=1121322 RepID=A0A1M6QAJ5_9FIRM|nr:transposase, IS5 family [Anaerocolumna jejuensis DSM 15929]